MKLKKPVLFFMQRMTLFCVLLVMTHAGLWASGAPDRFKQALERDSAGNPGEAVKIYEEIAQENGFSSALFFNMANAYYRQGALGKAILNYKRAQRLSPRDPDIAANLQRAQTQAGIALPKVRWWQGVIRFFTPLEWSYITAGLFIVFGVLMCVRPYVPGAIGVRGEAPTQTVKKWRFIIAVAALAVFLAAICMGVAAQPRHQAVVLVKQAAVLVSPFAGAEPVAHIAEGQTVDVDKKHGDYIKVRFSKKEFGWVERGNLEAIEMGLLD